jgi:hypothetical protein
MTYEDVRNKLFLWSRSGSQAQSYRHSITAILATAEKWGIDPREIEPINIINLCEIIVPANKAIQDGDRKGLVQLFRMASSLTNASLRIYLRNNRQRIVVLNGRPDEYEVCFTKRQLDTVQRRTRLSLDFLVLERK